MIPGYTMVDTYIDKYLCYERCYFGKKRGFCNLAFYGGSCNLHEGQYYVKGISLLLEALRT
jgi:hypothetical protein